ERDDAFRGRRRGRGSGGRGGHHDVRGGSGGPGSPPAYASALLVQSGRGTSRPPGSTTKISLFRAASPPTSAASSPSRSRRTEANRSFSTVTTAPSSRAPQRGQTGFRSGW